MAFPPFVFILFFDGSVSTSLPIAFYCGELLKFFFGGEDYLILFWGATAPAFCLTQ